MQRRKLVSGSCTDLNIVNCPGIVASVACWNAAVSVYSMTSGAHLGLVIVAAALRTIGDPFLPHSHKNTAPFVPLGMANLTKTHVIVFSNYFTHSPPHQVRCIAIATSFKSFYYVDTMIFR